MKLNILDVPRRYANAPSKEAEATSIEPLINPEPDLGLTSRSGFTKSRQAIVELAKRDGWLEVYDFRDASKVTMDGTKIAKVKGQLGGLPDLVPSDPGYEPVGGSVGALGSILNGVLHFESEIAPTNLTIMTSVRAPGDGACYIGSFADASRQLMGFSHYSDGSTNAAVHEGYTYPLVSPFNTATHRVSLDSGVQTTYSPMSPEPTVVSHDGSPGSLRIGGVLAPVDDGPGAAGDEGSNSTLRTLETVNMMLYSYGMHIGTVVIANGRIGSAARARMERLLQRLSGAPEMIPRGNDAIRSGLSFASSSLSATGGTLSSALMPDRPSQIASLTKLLTCFLVKEVVPDSNLDDLIEHVKPYLNLDPGSTRQPVMNIGDKISWRDAIHLSLMLSHNHLTNTLAWHAGKLMSPGTSDPYGVFIAEMNRRTKVEWGWSEAVFSTPQGRYDCVATARHVNQLISRYSGFLLSALGRREYEYKIYRVGETEPEVGDALNIVRKGSGGEPLPELVGGKSGDTATIPQRGSAYASLSARYLNPGGSNQAATLLDTGEDSADRYRALSAAIKATRTGIGEPPDWSTPSNNVILRGNRLGSNNEAVATLSSEAWGGADVSIEPIDTLTSPRPKLWKGDLVTASVTVRGTSAISRRIRLRARVIGGRFIGSSGMLTSAAHASETSDEFNLSISGIVSSGGMLALEVIVDGGMSGNRFIAARDFKLKIDRSGDSTRGEYMLEIDSFSIDEQSQSGDSSDLSGSVGSFTALVAAPKYQSVIRDFGPGYLQGKPVRMSTQHGAINGKVIGVSGPGANGLMTIECASELAALNVYNITAQPFDGSLIDLFEYYFGLAGSSAPAITFSPELAGRTTVAPGWTGDLWQHVKMLCAAEGVHITLNPTGGVTVSKNRAPRDGWFAVTDETPQFPLHALAQSVEVYNYNSRRITDTLVYPPGGWDRDVPLLSVEAGEEIEHTLELSASITSFLEPTFQTSVGPDHVSSSVYTIIGDDEVHVNRAQWLAGGGSVTFEIGPDTRSIIVRMRGATGIGTIQGTPMRTFSLGLSAGDSSSRYSTLRILGTGVAFDREKINFKTGISKLRTATDVGATIDNPFINTMAKAASAGVAAAARFSGYDPSISISAPRSPSGELGGSTLGAGVIAAGGRYVVRRASYSPHSVSLEASESTSWGDVTDKLEGTYRVVEEATEGLSYREVQSRGLRYGAS